MRICPECKITVTDPVKHCPLCGADLSVSGADDKTEMSYPAFTGSAAPRSSFPFLAKLFAFLSLIAVFSCVLIDLLTAHRLSWSLYVVGGIAAAWGTVGAHLLTRINLNYLLLNDLVVISLWTHHCWYLLLPPVPPSYEERRERMQYDCIIGKE